MKCYRSCTIEKLIKKIAKEPFSLKFNTRRKFEILLRRYVLTMYSFQRLFSTLFLNAGLEQGFVTEYQTFLRHCNL